MVSPVDLLCNDLYPGAEKLSKQTKDVTQARDDSLQVLAPNYESRRLACQDERVCAIPVDF